MLSSLLATAPRMTSHATSAPSPAPTPTPSPTPDAVVQAIDGVTRAIEHHGSWLVDTVVPIASAAATLGSIVIALISVRDARATRARERLERERALVKDALVSALTDVAGIWRHLDYPYDLMKANWDAAATGQSLTPEQRDRIDKRLDTMQDLGQRLAAQHIAMRAAGVPAAIVEAYGNVSAMLEALISMVRYPARVDTFARAEQDFGGTGDSLDSYLRHFTSLVNQHMGFTTDESTS
ncbi:MAG: hypothetical protein J7513_01235 [Solirubrobacteraceae bacterium]|nr:hypothetical protein [Solirubrobacteraceae bacterium]